MFALIRKHYPELKIFWQCEEPGCEIYASNDVNHEFFNTQFILYYHGCDDTDYFQSKEELLKFVNEQYDKKFESLDELDKFIEDSDEYELAYYTFDYQS